MLDSDLNHVVGFCGFKGSGKDTSADHLVECFGYDKLSLATPIKEACKAVFGFPDEHLWGSSDLREIQDERYVFSGLDPVDGTPLREVSISEAKWWLRESDEEYFPRCLNPRLALTSMGTEWGRRLNDNIWVYSCLNLVRTGDQPLVTIPDVRFKNELSAIQGAGGKVVRLLRGGRKSNHPSELELESIPLSSFDFVIDNNGPKEFLFEELNELMSEILQPFR